MAGNSSASNSSPSSSQPRSPFAGNHSNPDDEISNAYDSRSCQIDDDELYEIEIQYYFDYKCLKKFVEIQSIPDTINPDLILEILRRVSKDYFEALFQERDQLKDYGDIQRLKEHSVFIMSRIEEALNMFRLLKEIVGISEIQRNEFLSGETALEAVKAQMIDFNLLFEGAPIF